MIVESSWLKVYNIPWLIMILLLSCSASAHVIKRAIRARECERCSSGQSLRGSPFLVYGCLSYYALDPFLKMIMTINQFLYFNILLCRVFLWLKIFLMIMFGILSVCMMTITAFTGLHAFVTRMINNYALNSILIGQIKRLTLTPWKKKCGGIWNRK